jgi:hypothetical protein
VLQHLIPNATFATTTDNENIKLNCFGESGAIQDSSPPGFGIETTTNDGETLLAITFKRATGDSVETFDGYYNTDSTAPTVEFCVKLTLGGKIFLQLAIKYTFSLDGAITIDNAVVLDACLLRAATGNQSSRTQIEKWYRNLSSLGHFFKSQLIHLYHCTHTQISCST